MSATTLGDANYIDNEQHKRLFTDLHTRKMADPNVTFTAKEQTIYDLMLLRINMKKELERDLPKLKADMDQFERADELRQKQVRQVRLEQPQTQSVSSADEESRYCCLLGVAAAVTVAVGIALCVLNVLLILSIPLMTLSIALIIKGGAALALVCMLS